MDEQKANDSESSNQKCDKQIFSDFFLNSSVHGFRYFGEKQRHWSERLWWLLALSCSIIGCAILIGNVYTKWQESPVVVSFTGQAISISDIQFPAVTICPEFKIRKSKFNLRDAYEGGDMLDDELFESPTNSSRMLKSLAMVCPDVIDSLQAFSIFFNLTQLNSNEVYEDVQSVAPQLNDVFMQCKWGDQEHACNKLFTPIVTDDGLCFAFNSYGNNGLYTEDIANEMLIKQGEYTYEPKYSLNAGFLGGLEVMLMLRNTEMDYLCRKGIQGFKVILHPPAEMPQASKYFFRIPMERHVTVALKPNVIDTTQGLLKYKPERRQCLMENEKTLRFFRNYTQRNCELECNANFTRKMLNCVKFAHPKSNGTKMCSVGSTIYNKEGAIMETVFGLKAGPKMNHYTKECNCLPACISTTYDTEISQLGWESAKYFSIANEVGLMTTFDEDEISLDSKVTVLSIFFKEDQYYASQRSELYNQTDFWASCGGIASLFMGISVLSLVEVLYHFTLRLCCRTRLQKSDAKSECTLTTPSTEFNHSLHEHIA